MFDRNPHKTSLTSGQQTQGTFIGIPCFEDLAALAKQNPMEFEALRIRLCHQLINSAPEHSRKRLLGIQFKIDMERKKARSPMAACLKISSMMNDSLIALNEALANPQEYVRNHYQHQADIIPLFAPESAS